MGSDQTFVRNHRSRGLEDVLTPDIYDPALNPLYCDVLAQYGVAALPCRVGNPDSKGKGEAGVGHAKKTPLRGLASSHSTRRKPIFIAGKPVARLKSSRPAVAPRSGPY